MKLAKAKALNGQDRQDCQDEESACVEYLDDRYEYETKNTARMMMMWL